MVRVYHWEREVYLERYVVDRVRRGNGALHGIIHLGRTRSVSVVHIT